MAPQRGVHHGAAGLRQATAVAPHGPTYAKPPRRLRADRRGSIAILAACSITLIFAAATMAVGLGQVYLAKANVQRIADQSAIAAALAYQQAGFSQTSALKAAQSLATDNGLGSASTNVTATYLTSSPSNDGNPAELVTVTYATPLVGFAGLAFSQYNVSVTASSVAEIEYAPACIYSGTNSAGSGFYTVSGAGAVGTNCNIISVSIFDLNLGGGGGTISGTNIETDGAIVANGGVTIVGTQHPNYSCCIQAEPYGSSDPNAPTGNTVLQTITNDIAAIPTAAPSMPSMGTAPTGSATSTCSAANATAATALTFSAGTQYGAITTPAVSCYIKLQGSIVSTNYVNSQSCWGSNFAICLSSNVTLNVLIVGPGTFNIAGILASAGTVNITVSGNPTINIFGGLETVGSGGTITIDGQATWNITGGILNDGGHTMSLCVTTCTSANSTYNIADGITVTSGNFIAPNGTYNIISGSIPGGYSTPVAAGLNIASNNTVTFGDGSFDIWGGIYLGTSATLNFGKTSGGCPSLIIPQPATGGPSQGYAISTGGGSNLNFSYGCELNQINGNVLVSGNFEMNTNSTQNDTWYINGGLNLSASGGSVWTGNLMQIFLSGVFSVGQGYANPVLTPQAAVTSSTIGNISTIVLASTSLSTSGSTFTNGTTMTISGGGIYLQHPLYIVDGATLTGGGNCLIVDTQGLALESGGTSNITTNCTGVYTNDGWAAAELVQ